MVKRLVIDRGKHTDSIEENRRRKQREHSHISDGGKAGNRSAVNSIEENGGT